MAKTKILLLIGLSAIISTGATFLITKNLLSQDTNSCQWQFINPFRCTEEGRFTNPDYSTTKRQIVNYIESQKGHGLTETSVYFRDLRNGPTFSIDPNADYLAASLYKLPILIRYLKDSETNSALLHEQFVYHDKPLPLELTQTLPPEQTLQDGQSYVIEDLLKKMIIYSDNKSRVALVDYYTTLQPKYDIIYNTLVELGISDPITHADPNTSSVESIGSIFRILYNASFLNLENSNTAITWLTQSSFRSGITSPIPASIPVANKFGFSDDGKIKQFHDCGIVYFPQHPYILCVMSEGADQDVMIATTAKISEFLYKEFVIRYNK